MALKTARPTKGNIHSQRTLENDSHTLTKCRAAADENRPPTRSLADELENAGADANLCLATFNSSRHEDNEMSGDPYDSYLVLELQAQNSAEIPTERPSLLPGTSAISRLHPATSFEDFLNADDDEAFVADLSRSDGSPNTSLESGAEFLSELFFEEEDSGSSSQVFDPDFMDDDSHDPSHDPFLDGPSTLSTTESNVPEDVPPPIPVRYDIVCEHAYKSPTLLTRRLKYLRQMHIHTELGRADLFDSSNPLVVPILHTPRQSHGLAWKAESGVVGGWADVDRPEPRYSTHFYGRPELLLEEERELIAMTTQRTILTVDQAQRLRLGA